MKLTDFTALIEHIDKGDYRPEGHKFAWDNPDMVFDELLQAINHRPSKHNYGLWLDCDRALHVSLTYKP